MKFQNMTITLTLVCLSTFAICVIGLIPMEQILVNTASGYQWEQDPYYNYDEERGFNFYITVSAGSCGAFASVTPSLVHTRQFDSESETEDWRGFANTNAQRDAYTSTQRNACFMVSQYIEMPEITASETADRGDIQVQVEIRRAFEGTILVPSGGTQKLKLNAGFTLKYGEAEIGDASITYEYQGKSVTRIVLRIIQDEIIKRDASDGRSSEAPVTNAYHPPIDCAAAASEIRFYDPDIDDKKNYSSRSEDYRGGFLYGFF